MDPIEEQAERQPLLATYTVQITLRGEQGTETPTLQQLEDAINGAVEMTAGGETLIKVTSRASRTDR